MILLSMGQMIKLKQVFYYPMLVEPMVTLGIAFVQAMAGF